MAINPGVYGGPAETLPHRAAPGIHEETAPGVGLACSTLDQELERLENQAARVQERVGAVLKPERAELAHGTRSQDGSISPLAQGIYKHAGRVGAIADQLGEIAARIDL